MQNTVQRGTLKVSRCGTMDFITRPATSWSLWQLLFFTVSTLMLTEGMSKGVLWFWAVDKVGSKDGKPSSSRIWDSWDSAFTAYNKLFTVGFNHLLVMFCWYNSTVTWGALTVSNTAIASLCILLVFDLFYYCWHRALHWKLLYRFIHKQHHREYAPHRGGDDAINSHPVEYMVTACFIPAAAMVVSHILQQPVHVAAVGLASIANAILSYANHTQLNVRLSIAGWELYASRNHNTHHRRGALGGNYAQICSCWDHLFGTFVEHTS
eukprot:TRINITY_DN67942_c0_g1_i1.p1 TRINITY_DN67942_c0_g1~~TRINITY_DN67942_c0_g1_i1.p1  ORF type:complete len:266 (-),score=16.29 TRINITY_DN67942_c0_g1_i1:93-890(-)